MVAYSGTTADGDDISSLVQNNSGSDSGVCNFSVLHVGCALILVLVVIATTRGRSSNKRKRPDENEDFHDIENQINGTSRESESSSTEHAEAETKPLLDGSGLDLFSREELSSLRFTVGNAKALREQLIALNRFIVQKCAPNHHRHFRPMFEVYEDDRYWMVITFIWQMQGMGTHRKRKKEVIEMGLDFLVQYFWAKLEVNLWCFRKDLQELYDTLPWGQFAQLMLLYTLRASQRRCVVATCDGAFHTREGDLQFFFGMGGDESNHALHDLFNVTCPKLKKWFGIQSNTKSLSLPQVLFEFAKILRTCPGCHQRRKFPDLRFVTLPNECKGNYEVVDENGGKVEQNKILPLPLCAVAETKEGIALHQLTEYHCGLSPTQVGKLTFEKVARKYEDELPFHFIDLIQCDQATFDAASNTTKRHLFRLIEQQTGKRLARCCFKCGCDSLNQPAKRMSQFDCHHVDDLEKDFNPSQGVYMSIPKQRAENKKTVMLCKPCHKWIHSNREAMNEFMSKFKRLGYRVAQGGTIESSVPRNDGLRIICSSVVEE